MDLEYQTAIPESFMALFAASGRMKPVEPLSAIRERYGYCEDLASLLVDTARTRKAQLGIDESDVLDRIATGLRSGEVVANEREAEWVMARLAEMLDWRR
ncbi:ATPase with chaperone activity [Ideonella sp. DXS29W]|uniref:ATPase with chaperone activity n=1 Tax=Ideonella lacteola TaxID=2984193 RepID=A0ABU9BXK3_9BURK